MTHPHDATMAADDASGEALLLLHGVTMSATVWDCVVPALQRSHRLLVPTALGHRGGPPALGHPVTLSDMVDDAESVLDSHGESRVHVAGNSLGGWVALELARRGRALSVCALSPAGFWVVGEKSHTRATDKIGASLELARATRRASSSMMRVPAVRKFALKDIAQHGDRLSRDNAVGITRDLIDCTVAGDLLSARVQFDDFTDLPCPVSIVWSEKDRLFPPAVNEAIARKRVPGARFETLNGVGHVPMLDAPTLVAEAILRSTSSS